MLIKFIARCNSFASVYGTDCLELLSAERVGPFVVRKELVACGSDDVTIEAAYTQAGLYIGSKHAAEVLTAAGCTEQVQPKDGGATCTVGYNPTEQKWYGWSHRAMFGFGIGSKVKAGDCAFNPSSPSDIETSLLEFWSLTDPMAWRECENEQTVCKNRLFRSVQTRQDGVLGWLVAYDTIFIGADRHLTGSHFTAYPKKWGKGAWIAETLEDAKQMAIDFSKGVS